MLAVDTPGWSAKKLQQIGRTDMHWGELQYARSAISHALPEAENQPNPTTNSTVFSMDAIAATKWPLQGPTPQQKYPRNFGIMQGRKRHCALTLSKPRNHIHRSKIV